MLPIESAGYSIVFPPHAYDDLSELIATRKYSTVFILADTNTAEKCLSNLLSNLAIENQIEIIEIENGESVKNIETASGIWNALIELGADRKSLLINLGGGVVTDIGGFVASTFKRGIDFINIPTSLLAMVDASIGGKNGIDIGNLKNQVGTIVNPEMVVVDSSYLETLPASEMRSGLAEMLKHGLIADKSYWREFHNLSGFEVSELDRLIYRSIEIKNQIVMQDPDEGGIRKALNFGHTLGHAIESHFLNDPQKPTLLHGEAIAAGMIMEAYLSLKKGLLSEADYIEIKSTIKNIFEDIIFTENDVKCILELLIHDKKNEYGNVRFALIDGIGAVALDHGAENDLIEDAFSEYKK